MIRAAIATVLIAAASAAGASDWYEIRSVPLHAHDLTWHGASGRLLASTAADAGTFANAIVPIDPESGELGSPVLLDSEPFQLALSDDGSMLYAGLDGIGAVQPVVLPGLVPGAAWALPPDPVRGLQHAGDLAVQPGAPSVVAVALHRIPARRIPTAGSVAIFESGVARPEVAGVPASRIVFADAGSLYGSFNEFFYDEFFWRMQVDRQGVRVLQETDEAIEGFFYPEMIMAAGRLYSSFGRVLEPSQPAYYGTYLLWQTPSGVAVDLARGLVYFLEENGISIHDLERFVRLDVIPLPGKADERGSLVLWREGRLAFRDGSRVYLIDATLPDADGDGHGDPRDNCRLISNPSQSDVDADRVGDACDPDDESPDVPLALCEDSIQYDVARLQACFFGAGFVDADGDDEHDPRDRCPETARYSPVDDSGCSIEQFCAIQGAECEAADWRNDEAKRRPGDCRRVGSRLTGYGCQPAARRKGA